VKDNWEVPREDITILDKLGQGSFGTVYNGILRGGPGRQIEIRVAIKVETF